MAANYYNINISKLIAWLIPPRQRFIVLVEWLKVLASPLSWLFQQFTNYLNDVAYRTMITPQVCYLERLLNDSFDNTQRRITITDGLNNTPLLIHMDEAQEPLITHMEGQGQLFDEEIPVIHDESAYQGGADFNVNIPFTLTTEQENRLKSLLNTYKLAGKQYKILYT